jgi:hypothetical protein
MLKQIKEFDWDICFHSKRIQNNKILFLVFLF